MEGLVIVAIVVGAVGFLAYRARGKVGLGGHADIAAQKDIPRRPASGGLGARLGGPGNDLLDDRTGDAGARPRH
jgi:hypothetical protein